MSSMAGVPQEMAAVITALILLFSACGAYIKYRLKRLKDEKAAYPFKFRKNKKQNQTKETA